MSRDEILKLLEEADEAVRVAIQLNRGIGVDAGTPYREAIEQSASQIVLASNRLRQAQQPDGELDKPKKSSRR